MASSDSAFTFQRALQALAAPKTIFGIAAWKEGAARGKPKQPITPFQELVATLAIDGQPFPGLELRGSAHPHDVPHRVQLMIRCGGHTLERVAFNPPGFHTHGPPGWPRSRLLPLQPRRYRLNENDWPPGHEGPCGAEPIPHPIPDAAALIRYVLQEWQITGILPSPDYFPRLVP